MICPVPCINFEELVWPNNWVWVSGSPYSDGTAGGNLGWPVGNEQVVATATIDLDSA